MRMTLIMLCLAGIWSAAPRLCWSTDDETAPTDAQAVPVELFAGLRSEQLQATVIPHSYALMTLRVRNVSQDLLEVSLPKSFAAIPTARWEKQQKLAQQDRSPSLADGYQVDRSGSQGLAASTAGSWMKSPPAASEAAGSVAVSRAADQPPTWTLAPRQQVQVQVPCFCLEFGKPNPNRRIPYQLVELRELNSRPAIEELLERFAREELDQRVVQLATWHVANGVPWETLAGLKFPRVAGRGGSDVTSEQLLAARQLSESLASADQQRSLGDR
jgi:hypothetical protein